MLLNSKRGQLSIEMVILILAVLLSGTVLAAHMTKDTNNAGEVKALKKLTLGAFSNSAIESGASVIPEEENPQAEDGEDTEPEEEEENNLDKIYAKLDINPTSSAKNNEFEATLYGGGTVELQKKGPTKGIYINETFYPLENTQKEINVTKIILRIKCDCVIIINDTIVFDKNDKNFIIECVEGGTCPIPITIGMENGAGTYWLEIDVDDVKVTSESSGSGKN
ncbi:hypothetical protein GYY_03470 [Methanococcus maripaludis X1]|uniref:Class III signal peptide-containing protein n=1 Tax=Methanococcus maripaludis X1 TaxID=1053692 RepID=G0H4E2_METMI|nr:class III signal peptide-containing protein [Methanococcus maripaludis]AEK19573.1 hypothetical protein GYY_03470 [Methanococcus maripaludis X1]